MQAEKKQIADRIKAFSEILKQKGIDAYIIPTDDFHGSEYVGSYFKCRTYMSGFTGSAGTLIVFADGLAGLYTDGRYFIQAESELAHTGITLYKSGQKGVKPLKSLLADTVKDGGVIGFDGRVMSIQAVEQIKREFLQEKKTVHFSYKEDLVDSIWKERPALSEEPVFVLSESYAGKSAASKIEDVRKLMQEKEVDYLLLSSLDDIAWLLNIRSDDVAYNPVMLGYLLLGKEDGILFSSLKKRADSDKAAGHIKALGIKMQSYDECYKHLASMEGSKIWLDQNSVNFALYQAGNKNAYFFAPNPTILMKAVKNKTEIANMKMAHQKDGVAVTKYLYWLKHLPADSKGRLWDNGEVVTEIYAAEKLESFRRMGQNYLGQSFDPIVAAGAHGAIVHYSASEETDAPLTIDSFVLHDTGGQYLEGTTDITRTVCIGEASKEMKRHFTLVLKGNLRLMDTVFLKGVRGENLDAIARQPLWKEYLNFNHGTGHGVGYLLNVHEGPNHIRFHITDAYRPENSAVFTEGMITSNEPGLYLENQYGIRHENLILCVKKEENEYGTFLGFEPLTLVPFDLDGIDVKMLTKEEKDILNQYHKLVYDSIAGDLSKEEAKWLLYETREI